MRDILNKKVPVLRLVKNYGFKPKESGDRYVISCPFHPKDNTPSLTIYPSSNSWFCYGCSSGTTPLEFVKQIEDCSYKEAEEKLKKFLSKGAVTRPSFRKNKKEIEMELRFNLNVLYREFLKNKGNKCTAWVDEQFKDMDDFFSNERDLSDVEIFCNSKREELEKLK